MWPWVAHCISGSMKLMACSIIARIKPLFHLYGVCVRVVGGGAAAAGRGTRIQIYLFDLGVDGVDRPNKMDFVSSETTCGRAGARVVL